MERGSIQSYFFLLVIGLIEHKINYCPLNPGTFYHMHDSKDRHEVQNGVKNKSVLHHCLCSILPLLHVATLGSRLRRFG